MKIDLKTGAGIASAVALVLGSAQPARADDSDKSASGPVKCLGGNSCKGKSACSTATNGCAGENACKGKGWVMTKSAAECKKAGGTVSKDG